VAAYPPEHAILLGAGDLRPREEQLDAGGVSVELGVSPEEYTGAISRIKELIASGDTYQMNHTCRACLSWDVDPAEYFLRAVCASGWTRSVPRLCASARRGAGHFDVHSLAGHWVRGME